MSWKASASVKDLRKDGKGKSLTPSEKCLLYTLADYYDEEKGYAWPSMDRLAEESMMSERQARRLVRDLETRGILSVEMRKKQTSLYRFRFGKGVELTIQGGHIDPHEGDTQGTDGGHPGYSKGDIAVAPEPPRTSKEPEKESSPLLPGFIEQNGNGKGRHISPEEVVRKAFAYFCEVTGKTDTYELTKVRMQKGVSRWEWALKRTGGKTMPAGQLMRGAINAMASSDWHMKNGATSWDKNLFKSDDQFQEWIERAEKAGVLED